MIRRVERVLGTPIKSEGRWVGNYSSKEEAVKAAKAALLSSFIADQCSAKYEIAYMK